MSGYLAYRIALFSMTTLPRAMPGWLVVDTCWTPPRGAESPQARIWPRICRATASQRQWQRPTEAIGAAQKRAMRKIAARRHPRPTVAAGSTPRGDEGAPAWSSIATPARARASEGRNRGDARSSPAAPDC